MSGISQLWMICHDKSITLNTSLVEKICQLKVAVTRCQILCETLKHKCVFIWRIWWDWWIVHLIPIAHEVMQCDEALVHHHPVGVECPLYQEVGQGGDRDIGLVCTLKQIWKHDVNVFLLFDLSSLETYSQDVSSWVQWSPQWLPCTPPWPGPDLPDCVAPPGSCHWESVLLDSASWSYLRDIWVSSLIWNWTLIACWWQRGGSTGSGALFCVVCVNCVMGHCATSLLLLTLLVPGELS